MSNCNISFIITFSFLTFNTSEFLFTFLLQICSPNEAFVGSQLLLGLVSSLGSDMGIQIYEGTKDMEENFAVIFSIKFMQKLTRQMDKLQFYGIPKLNSHVEMVEKEWVDVTPTFPNSLELSCSIYSSLNGCSLDKVCVLKITE